MVGFCMGVVVEGGGGGRGVGGKRVFVGWRAPFMSLGHKLYICVQLLPWLRL